MIFLRIILEKKNEFMQAIRQSLMLAVQRRVSLVRIVPQLQQVRFQGSDPQASTIPGGPKKGGKQTDPSKGSDLNKSKSSDKKRKLSTTDDTDQPGATRKDWSKPDQIVGNDPPYGKAGGSTDAHDPNRGRNG